MKKLFYIMKNLKSASIFGSEMTDGYGIKCMENDKKFDIPSVTHILKQTMSVNARKALELWKKHIINSFGEHYFNILCKGLLNDGKLFHSLIQDTLLHKKPVIHPSIRSAYGSVKPILDNIVTVEAIETPVIHPTLRYQGIVDCIATYRDNMYIIDWKKSNKPKATLAATFDAPVQLAAYIGAVNASDEYPFTINRGLVVVAYTNGNCATVHELNKDTLQKAWEEWLRRLEQFYTNLNENNDAYNSNGSIEISIKQK